MPRIVTAGAGPVPASTVRTSTEHRPQLRGPGAPRGQHQLGVGGPVVLAQRTGQVPGVQMPLSARHARHLPHRHLSPPVPVVRQFPAHRQPPAVGARRLGERGDVLGAGRIGQRGELGRVLPGELAGQRFRGDAGGHQPGEPAGRGVVEVLRVVISHAAQVARQVDRAPLGAGRRSEPGHLGELGHRHGKRPGSPRGPGGSSTVGANDAAALHGSSPCRVIPGQPAREASG